MKRAILVGAGAIAISLGSVAFAAPAMACPPGTVQTHFSGVCTAGQGGGAAPQIVAPVQSGAGGHDISTIPGTGITSVDGIPCNLNHQSTCQGLLQNP